MGVPSLLHLPGIPRVPPLWRESRFAFELADLRRSPVFRGHGVPEGDGRPVMLIPGFLAGDGSLGTMTHWLAATGYPTPRARGRAGAGLPRARRRDPRQRGLRRERLRADREAPGGVRRGVWGARLDRRPE